MENRVTRLLIPVLIGLAIWLLVSEFLAPRKKARPPQPVDKPIPAGRAIQVLATGRGRQFTLESVGGTPGEPGLRPTLHEFGAAIKEVHLWDHFQKPGQTEAENILRVIDPVPATFSFAIEDFQSKFPVKLPESGAIRRMQDVNWVRLKGPADDPKVVYELAYDKGVKIQKIFRFFERSRTFQLTIRIRNENTDDPDLPGWWRYRLRGASVLANPASEYLTNPARAFAAFAGEDEEPVSAAPAGKPNWGDYPDVLRAEPGKAIAYAGSSSRFFTCIIWPEGEDAAKAIQAVEVRSLPFEDGEVRETKAGSNVAPLLQIRQRVPRVPDGESAGVSELTFNVYLGPKSRKVLKEDDELARFLPVLDLDLTSGCFCQPPGTRTMARVLLWLLLVFHGLVGNWGLAIIMLTVLVRLSLMPLNVRQAKAMRVYSQKMQKLKPEMDKIKERHKKNPQKMNKELMQFQKKHKLIPPLMGCLPMFLTLPIFIGLFSMLRASYELRHQPFVAWISDLSLPDRLAAIGDMGIPLVPKYLNLLPLLMTALWVVNAFNQPLHDDPQQRSIQRMMRFMPVMFLIFLYNYASGLALYFTVSALWSFVEQRIVKKKIGAVGMATPI